MENNRNFFITIALSVLILALWQYFYVLPRSEAQPGRLEASTAPPLAIAPDRIVAALASTPRVCARCARRLCRS